MAKRKAETRQPTLGQVACEKYYRSHIGWVVLWDAIDPTARAAWEETAKLIVREHSRRTRKGK